MTGQHRGALRGTLAAWFNATSQLDFLSSVSELRLDADRRLRLRELSHEDFDMPKLGGAPPLKDPALSPQYVPKNPH
jgi:hypothetical protein